MPLTFSVRSQTIPFRAKYIFGERTPSKFFSSSFVNTVSGLGVEVAGGGAEAAEFKAEAPLLHGGTEAEVEPVEAEYSRMIACRLRPKVRVKREDEGAETRWELWLREKAILVGETDEGDDNGRGDCGSSTESDTGG